MRGTFFLLVISLLLSFASVYAFDHSTVIDKYEGSKTCIQCHEDKVKEVFTSLHYQWIGETTDIVGKKTVEYGKRFAYNDYCGAVFFNGTVPINWIGNATLKVAPKGKEELKGKFIASGCSMCHIGFGIVPSKNMSREQLENIDCFVCHVPGYLAGAVGEKKKKSRVLIKEDNIFKRVPNQDLNYKELAKKIKKKPDKENCLACHAFSGGGPGFKRPNIDPSLMGNVSEDVDVHLARGLVCVDCHKAEKHRISGRAMDTWEIEGERVKCEDCHTSEPHKNNVLNKHTKTVACQTCHIPNFARVFPTDVKRSWKEVEFSDKFGRWEPKVELKGNVTPVYAWWNGKDRVAYLYPEKAKVVDGKIYLFKPVGSIDDPNSKIYPFKYHEAEVPFDKKKKIPIPIKVGMVFATGNVTKAISLGAKQSGLEFTGEYVTLVRYMAVNHGVVPKEKALQCSECHGGNRINWEKLGYKGDPQQFGGRFKEVEKKPVEEKKAEIEKPSEFTKPEEKKGICGPTAILAFAVLPLILRKFLK